MATPRQPGEEAAWSERGNLGASWSLFQQPECCKEYTGFTYNMKHAEIKGHEKHQDSKGEKTEEDMIQDRAI